MARAFVVFGRSRTILVWFKSRHDPETGMSVCWTVFLKAADNFCGA